MDEIRATPQGRAGLVSQLQLTYDSMSVEERIELLAILADRTFGNAQISLVLRKRGHPVSEQGISRYRTGRLTLCL